MTTVILIAILFLGAITWDTRERLEEIREKFDE